MTLVKLYVCACSKLKHRSHITLIAMVVWLVRSDAKNMTQTKDTACFRVLHCCAPATCFVSKLAKFDVRSGKKNILTGRYMISQYGLRGNKCIGLNDGDVGKSLLLCNKRKYCLSAYALTKFYRTATVISYKYTLWSALCRSTDQNKNNKNKNSEG